MVARLPNIEQYSGDLKSDHLKFGNIWNLEFLKVGFQMVQFSNGWALAMTMAIMPIIWKPDHWKSRLFGPDFKWFTTKWWKFVRISNGWASRFQIPFEIWTICNPTSFWPFKSRLVQISDPHCRTIFNNSNTELVHHPYPHCIS